MQLGGNGDMVGAIKYPRASNVAITMDIWQGEGTICIITSVWVIVQGEQLEWAGEVHGEWVKAFEGVQQCAMWLIV